MSDFLDMAVIYGARAISMQTIARVIYSSYGSRTNQYSI